MQHHTEAAPPDHFPTETTALPACRRPEIVELSDGAALVAAGAIAAFAIKTNPRTESLVVADQTPFVTACACASCWCAPPGDTPETEHDDVGAVKVPVLAGAS